VESAPGWGRGVLARDYEALAAAPLPRRAVKVWQKVEAVTVRPGKAARRRSTVYNEKRRKNAPENLSLAMDPLAGAYRSKGALGSTNVWFSEVDLFV